MGLLQEISSDEKKSTRPITTPMIEPPGKPRGVVAGDSGTDGTKTVSMEPEKISCRHFRTKKILLVGNDSMGALNWGDVTPGRGCLDCGAIFEN